MTFSPLTTRTIATSQHGPRSRTIDHVILHHAASGNLQQVLGMISTGSRRVSYNYVIGQAGEIVGVVSEDRRSWSVANEPWDSRSITICAINSAVGGAWPVSDATTDAMTRLVADICTRRGIPRNRDRIFGHRELWTRHRAGYATACPGGLNLDRVATGTAATPTTPEQEEDDMIRISAAGRGIALIGPGYARQLRNDEEVAQSGAIVSRTLEGNDRQFDLWVSMAVDGRVPTPAIPATERALTLPPAADEDGRA